MKSENEIRARIKEIDGILYYPQNEKYVAKPLRHERKVLYWVLGFNGEENNVQEKKGLEPRKGESTYEWVKRALNQPPEP